METNIFHSFLDIHLFSDESLIGVCTIAIAVVNQQNIFTQNLITIKSRLARKNLSIPRLELVVTQMSASLVENVKICLNKLNVKKMWA